MDANRRARVKSEYRPQYLDPIKVAVSERVSVGEEDEQFRGWIWCRAIDGREGWVPAELLTREGTEATVLRDYSARELEVKPGDGVVVEEERHGWLLVRNANGERGRIPASHVEPQANTTGRVK